MKIALIFKFCPSVLGRDCTSDVLTVFESNELIRIILPQLFVFICMAHQRKYNFHDNSLYPNVQNDNFYAAHITI